MAASSWCPQIVRGSGRTTGWGSYCSDSYGDCRLWLNFGLPSPIPVVGYTIFGMVLPCFAQSIVPILGRRGNLGGYNVVGLCLSLTLIPSRYWGSDWLDDCDYRVPF